MTNLDKYQQLTDNAPEYAQEAANLMDYAVNYCPALAGVFYALIGISCASIDASAIAPLGARERQLLGYALVEHANTPLKVNEWVEGVLREAQA